MDFLKKQLDTIQQNLAGLNATQKMLTGALVAIMVMTLFWWGRYAGTAEMEPVLNQTLTEEDISRMSASLDSRGITYKISGGKLLVPADRKQQALAELAYQQMLPRNSKSGFDEMFGKMSIFNGPQERDQAMNRAREITLSQVIGSFPNIASADVLIDALRMRQIGKNISPSATVNIKTRGGTGGDNKLVNAAAELVMGAVADISRDKIRIVVDGRAQNVPNTEAGYGEAGNLIEAIAAWESREARKIESQLYYIEGLRASVTGTLNTTTEETQSKTHDEKTTFVQPRSIETTTVETNSSSASGGDTGVLPNVGGLSVGTSTGPTQTSSESKEKIENVVLPSETVKRTKKPAGEFTALTVSVRVPRSYFIAVLKNRAGGKDPSPVEVDAALSAELPNIQRNVRTVTNIKKDDDIFVAAYDEAMPMLAATTAAGVAVSSGGITGIVGSWGKELAVGALAVISLFMVSTMVKRSTPAPIVHAAAEVRQPSALSSAEDVAGFAAEGGSTLSGMELDDDAIQTQQMLDQVQNMVNEDPDAAANLVKRWLNRT